MDFEAWFFAEASALHPFEFARALRPEVSSRTTKTPGSWWRFRKPVESFEATEFDQVSAVIQRAEDAARTGLWAVGAMSYEAGAAFDAAIPQRLLPDSPTPLVWFSLFGPPESASLQDFSPSSWRDTQGKTPFRLSWRPARNADQHRHGVEAIRAAIAAGDLYQANFTFPFVASMLSANGGIETEIGGSPSSSALDVDPRELFLRLWRNQRAPFACYLEHPDFAICSSSPELFFARSGSTLTARPMKGTRRRGLDLEEDRALASALRSSRKDRAENLMIVDMVRNDLGRIARPGSVQTRRLFEVEHYETVLQLTSTVTAESTASLRDVFAALFPCASITGAPKIRAMEFLNRLEESPRGMYTGALGLLAPGGDARFSVGIRTLVVDRRPGRQGPSATYGSGGGIVWDSVPEEEYDEARAKAAVLFQTRPEFRLLETFRHRERGFVRLASHLMRLRRAAEYFGFDFQEDLGRNRLDHLHRLLPKGDFRIRLLLGRDGELSIHSDRLSMKADHHGSAHWGPRVAVDPNTTPDSPFLRHKTTHREAYAAALARCSGADEVLLRNSRGVLTEATRANLVLELDDGLWTPPTSDGLLDGVLRQELIESGRLRERSLSIEDLRQAKRCWLISCLRGWIAFKPDVESVEQ